MPTQVSIRFVAFDDRGAFIDRSEFDSILTSIPDAEAPTDAFVFSHGWKNSFADASETYNAVIDQMTSVADSVAGIRPTPFRPLALGVIWPSKAWDEADEEGLESAGAAGGGRSEPSTLEEAVYNALSPERATSAGFRSDVLRLQKFVLKNHLNDREREEFRSLLRRHAEPSTNAEDQSVFESDAPAEGLEGLTAGDFSARDVFRNFTYWQMKKRAGVVGQSGVRECLAAVQARFPQTRVHLVGHSFGCKVVLAAVAGPGDSLSRPVQTVVLLQGAVSHEAMAEQVSGTNSAGGYRGALERSRVDGPIVATYSRLDKACGNAYPLGSRLGGHVGELEGFFDRFRALGAVGARGIEDDLNHPTTMRDVGDAYAFGNRGVWSVDGGTSPSAFIRGHSDLATPQVAWLIWSAATRR